MSRTYFEYYERNLPHWHPPGRELFVTWRLYGSLPQSLLILLKQKKRQLTAGRHFALAERELDKGVFGPLWLKEPRIAEHVVETLQRGTVELSVFDLHAYVVMANHVHVLMTPRVPLARIMRGIKRRTAAWANEILGLKGQPFWQEESFDHWIRHAAEFEKVKSYIEWNPVKAGLVKRPDEWRWSSAWRGSTGL